MAGQQIIEEIEKRLMFSRNIMENEHCIEWLTGSLSTEESEQELLFEPNKEKFQRLFGNHQFSFNLDKEYLVWRLNKGSQKMYCIAHQEGTFYQVFYSSGKQKFAEDEYAGKMIIEFLDFVRQRLSSEMH